MRISTLLLGLGLLGLPVLALADQPQPFNQGNALEITGTGGGGGGAHPSNTDLELDDDVEVQLGDDNDFQLQYDSTDTRLEWNSTDCDGGGTDCTVLSVEDGTDDVNFADRVNLNRGSRLVFDADTDSNTYIFSSPTNDDLLFYVGGSYIFKISFSGYFSMGDNRQIYFGSDEDYALLFRSATSQFELFSTDIDGGGTDGAVFTVDDGTDDVAFNGSLELQNGQYIFFDTNFDRNDSIVGAGDGTIKVFVENTSTFDFQSSRSIVRKKLLILQDVPLALGNIDDYTILRDFTATSLRFTSTDCDGGGTDCDWMSVQDGTDDVDFTGIVQAAGGLQLPTQTNTSPSAPATCDASNKGRMEVVDDSDDGAGTEVCYCGMTDDTTYDWLDMADNTACSFY